MKVITELEGMTAVARDNGECGLYGNGHMPNAVSETGALAGPAPRRVHPFAKASQTVERDPDDAP